MKAAISLLFCLLILSAGVMAQQDALFVVRDSNESSKPVIYPNPTAGTVYIEHARPVTEVSVINLLGQVMGSFETNHNRNYILDISELRNGMYFVRVTDAENNIYIQKVIRK